MSALNRCKADKRQVTPFEYNPRPTAQERKENEESWQRLSVLIDGCIDHLEDETFETVHDTRHTSPPPSLALEPLFNTNKELIAHRRKEVIILGRYINVCQQKLLQWQDMREANTDMGDYDEALSQALKQELSFACDERARVRSSILDLEEARETLSDASNEVEQTRPVAPEKISAQSERDTTGVVPRKRRKIQI